MLGFKNEKYGLNGTRLVSFLRTCNNYGTVFKWLILDSVLRFRKMVVLVILTGFLGVFTQIGAIGLIIRYAQALESGGIVRLLGIEFEARSSKELLILCGLLVLLSLLFSAWSIYFCNTRMIKLCRRYEEFCSKRILKLSGLNLIFRTESGNGYIDDKHFFRLAHTDSRYCGRVFRLFLKSVTAAITFPVATVVLFYINPFLSFLILLALGIYSCFQYKINVNGARDSILMEKNARNAICEYQQVIRQQKEIVAQLPEYESWLEKVFTSTKVKNYLDAFEGRLRAPDNSQFISNILFAVVIFIAFLILGTSIILEGEEWGRLIIYLVALRYGLVTLTNLSRSITSVNRFYPQIRRYFQFIQNTETPLKDEAPVANYVVRVRTNAIAGSLESWNLSKGSRVGLISPVTLNRYTLAFLTDCLLGHSRDAARNALGSMWFTTSQYGCLPGRPLRESLGFPLGYKWQELLNEMKGTGLEGRLKEKLPQGLEKPISPDTWNQVDHDLKFTLVLLRACHSNCQWIMLEETGLRSLTDITRQYFLRRLSDRIMVIVHHKDITAVGKYNEDVISLIDEKEIIALGNIDWFKENHARVEEIINKNYNRAYTCVDNEDDIDMDKI